jgi:hypothetical protein
VGVKMIKGLRHVAGITADQIKEIFDRENIEYRVRQHSKKYPKGPYYPDVAISVRRDDHHDACFKLRATPDVEQVKAGTYSYLCYYKIEKDFDFNQLNQQVKFDHGLLVARTRIYWKDNEL